MDYPHEANAVRDLPQAEIHIFPAEAIIRRRPPPRDYTDDQVVVIHRGDSEVYDTPSALYAAFADADPLRKSRLAEAEAYLATARSRANQAREVLAAALLRKLQAERLLGLVCVGILAAVALGATLLVAGS